MDHEDHGPLESASMPLDVALQVAVGLHQRGNLANAEAIYRGILEAVPGHPDALHFLGVLSHQLGRREEAVALIREALIAAPEHPDMHNNLGNVLKEQGRAAEAEAAYRSVIALRPDHADAHNNLGVALKDQGRLEDAASAYCSAIEIQPDHADAHLNLGNVLRRLGRVDEAVAACRRAVELKPDHSDAYENLATALFRAGRLDEAIGVLRQWLGFVPGHPIASHMLVAYSGKEMPERAGDDYVRVLFDRFAGSFDECLGHLEYRAPQLVAEALESHLPSFPGALEILDAGCGTGLCGPLLTGPGRRLTGVDLSPGMLGKAQGLGVYDALVEGELTAYLESRPKVFHAIVSADTLVYFGTLAAVAAAAAAALRPGGLFVFTVEKSDPEGPGFVLNPHGRYGHRRDYVERTLAEAGLGIVAVDEPVLRKEVGHPVRGLLVVARNPVGD